MNFLIIGHSVVDKIVEKDLRYVKPGGIFYSVISLLSQIEEQDKIFLCTNMDNQNVRYFKDIYDQVDNQYVRYESTIPRVELLIDESFERKETYSEIASNLVLPENDLDHFDGILINMITGYDISLPQLVKLRKNYTGIIYFDVHTLSRGINEEMIREFRRIKNFKKWAKCIDILQANESELKTLSKKSEEEEIVAELISHGIKQVVITRSKKGASVYYKYGDNISHIHRDALKLEVNNKVGCGDVFGAVYFYTYIKNKNMFLALENANVSAGISTTYLQTSDYIKLKKDALEQRG